MHCLRKDPAERPQTAAEVVRVLEMVTDDGRRTGGHPRRRCSCGRSWTSARAYVVAAVAVVLWLAPPSSPIGLRNGCCPAW